LIDTCIVVTILVVAGVLPYNKLFTLIINSYIYKVFFTLCSTPLFYIGVLVIRKAKI